MGNRYNDGSRFVPAEYEQDRREKQWDVAIPIQGEVIQVGDVSPAWNVDTKNPSRDSVSAKDRAEAVQIRARPVWVMVGSASAAVTAIYTIFAMVGGWGAPWALDRIAVFLTVGTALGLFTYLRLNRLDYDHSRAGVERMKIKTAGQVRLAEIDAEMRIKTEALRATLRMLEQKDSRNGRQIERK